MSKRFLVVRLMDIVDARPLLLATVLALGWLGGCSESAGPTDTECDTGCGLATELTISNPLLATTSAAGSTALASVGVSESPTDSLVFVSLPPGTSPAGTIALIRNQRLGDSVLTSLTDGGFDPVPLNAVIGDTVEVLVDGALQSRTLVRASRRPVVVRTEPPPRKRDHPLNAPIVIVFSEPISAGTLTSSSVQLFRGSFAVPGTLALLPGAGTVAAFTPSVQLARNTAYRLVVSQAVNDLDGDALEASMTMGFTTGQVLTGPAASIDALPDSLVVIDIGATYQLSATVRDSTGSQLLGQPVTWSTDNPSVVSVSAAGLVTGFADGLAGVAARIGDLTDTLWVSVRANAPASVSLDSSSASVPAGDTIVLTATVRDAVGRVINFPSVTWTTSDSAVAIAKPVFNAPAREAVIGVSPGPVSVTATSGSVTGTAAITVAPPRPVASVQIAPESATVVVQAGRHFSATLRDANARMIYARPIVWESDNPAVATVDSNGFVEGVAVGSTIVTATAEGVSDSAVVTVTTIVFASLSAGGEGTDDFTCGLTADGHAYCWGDNFHGELGDGGPASATPVPVAGGLEFKMVSAGYEHACGVTTSGDAYCWGNGDIGRLGTGAGVGSVVPVPVSGGIKFTSVSAGGRHTCGLTVAGAIYCWGSNQVGQLGVGPASVSSYVPVLVSGGLSFSSVTAGGFHTCAITTAGAAYCWGYNNFGQLGLGFLGPENCGPLASSPIPCRTQPAAVFGGLTFATLSAGSFMSCGIATSGAAYCWGSLTNGPQATKNPIPAGVPGGITFTTIAMGNGHVCGVASGGAAYCWGWNAFGSLGDGSTIDRPAPVAVTGGLAFAALTTGDLHSCGLTTSGVGYCWGMNDYGALGVGTTSGPQICSGAACSTSPAKIAGQP